MTDTNIYDNGVILVGIYFETPIPMADKVLMTGDIPLVVTMNSVTILNVQNYNIYSQEFYFSVLYQGDKANGTQSSTY